MIFKNYYKILNISNDLKATQSEIKTAYREQAKKYHPDVNVNNKNAEERFKDINEAYRILSDPAQKKKYDKTWYNYVGKKMNRENNGQKEVNVNDIVNIFFGSGTVKKEVNKSAIPVKGKNIETKIDISVKEAFNGTKKRLSLVSSNKKNRIVEINIPKGIKSGEIINIPAQGKPGKNGGENGDLKIKINIENNDNFELKDNDIFVKLFITPWDAALGSKLTVMGVDGEISLLVPKGTQAGDKIAIPNKGYFKNTETKERGNLIIKTEIVVPKQLNDEEKDLFQKLKEVSEFNPNKEVNIK